jgi:hypothetical protein
MISSIRYNPFPGVAYRYPETNRALIMNRLILTALRDIDNLGDLTPWKPLRRLTVSLFAQRARPSEALSRLNGWLKRWWLIHPAIRQFYVDELNDFPDSRLIQNSLDWLLLTDKTDVELKLKLALELNKRWENRYQNKVTLDLLPEKDSCII